MMISDYDRRDLAEKLRETCDEIESEGNGLTVWELADILNIREDGLGLIESFNLDDVRNLADLIDRPTCKCVPMDSAGRPPFYTGVLSLDDLVGGCSECGYPFGNRNSIIGNPFNAHNYCPNCGAMVVTDDD